jgi:hypothetical protein
LDPGDFLVPKEILGAKRDGSNACLAPKRCFRTENLEGREGDAKSISAARAARPSANALCLRINDVELRAGF